jgi:predicted membrane channel-forming protein YqfA (hemolysin III family)
LDLLPAGSVPQSIDVFQPIHSDSISEDFLPMQQKTEPIFLFYISITLAILSSALYHFTGKSTPSNVNFTVSPLVTYAIAFSVTLLGFFFFPATNGITWAGIGLAIAIVGIEYGFLLIIAQAGIWASPRCWSMWSRR